MELVIMIISLVIAASICVFTKNRRLMGLSTILATAVVLSQAGMIASKVAQHGSYSPFPSAYINALSAIVVLLIALIGCLAAMYSVPYIEKEISKGLFSTTRTKQYFILFNLFIAAMLLSVTAGHPVVAWIFLEATTLTTVFLISFYDRSSTVEAAWKYLIINSTGLLLAFFGALLYFTCLPNADTGSLVSWQTLASHAAHLDPSIARVAFVFVLIGYGTKVGLVPMHTWKPDAYSKAPAPIGALFSGALLPVALTILLKFKVLTDIAIGISFSRHILIAFGVVSIAVAAFSILATKNYKRLLAYSSIEHAGVIVLGFGFGGLGSLAAVLHSIYHSLIKSALFMTSGNLLIKYHSAKIAKVRGAINVLPLTAGIFLVGFLAAVGLPPFGIFITEILTMTAGIRSYPVVVAFALASLVVAFVGFFRHASAMALSEKPANIEPGESSIWLVIPPFVLLATALFISIYIPDFLQTLIRAAASEY